jgi:hypothetical protein
MVRERPEKEKHKEKGTMCLSCFLAPFLALLAAVLGIFGITLPTQ